jgi:hypothetical protein
MEGVLMLGPVSKQFLLGVMVLGVVAVFMAGIVNGLKALLGS